VGFWSWLSGKGKRFTVADDVVWLSRNAKLQGLCDEIQRRLDEVPLVLVAAHFPATLDQAKAEIAKHNLPHLIHGSRLSAPDLGRYARQKDGPRIILVLAEALTPDEFPGPVDDALAAVPILVAERHFLRSKDEKILAFAASLDRPSRVTFHLSLEDPLMEAFVGQGIRELLGNLGMQESQPIANSLIARRIRSAQASLTKRVVDDRPAASAEEWLRLNLPGSADISTQSRSG
jgi:preprotein translocase subunit SecA